MPQRLILSLIALLLWMGLPPAQANCFCLQDGDMNIYKECEAVQEGAEPTPTYRCRFPGYGLFKIPDDKPMQRIEAGEPGCTPCRYADETNKPDVPRGD